MVDLTLHRMPVPGLPERLVLRRGKQCALIVPDRRQARRLADWITGLERPPEGAAVECTGEVRLVPADGGLLPHLTVLGNLKHGSRVTRASRAVPRSTVEQLCREMANHCGLNDVLPRYPYQITPGRRRLAGLARALRSEPAAVVLEDAPGLPTWGSLLDFERNGELLAAVLLLITTESARAAAFPLPAAGLTQAPSGAEAYHEGPVGAGGPSPGGHAGAERGGSGQGGIGA